MVIFRINLNDNNISKFTGIPLKDFPKSFNGFEMEKKGEHWYIFCDKESQIVFVKLFLDSCFMKTSCPYTRPNNLPVVQVKKRGQEEDYTNTLTLLGFKNYDKHVMYMDAPKHKPYVQNMIDKILSVPEEKRKKKFYNKAFITMCSSRDKRIYELIKEGKPKLLKNI
jgi:hypothetical protein